MPADVVAAVGRCGLLADGASLRRGACAGVSRRRRLSCTAAWLRARRWKSTSASRGSTSPGTPRKVKHLVATLPFSNACFARAYPVERLESLLDDIESAFAYFGGVVERMVLDNTSLAVKEILAGRGRVQTEAFEAFRGGRAWTRSDGRARCSAAPIMESSARPQWATGRGQTAGTSRRGSERGTLRRAVCTATIRRAPRQQHRAEESSAGNRGEGQVADVGRFPSSNSLARSVSCDLPSAPLPLPSPHQWPRGRRQPAIPHCGHTCPP